MLELGDCSNPEPPPATQPFWPANPKAKLFIRLNAATASGGF
jgi:hypothetical protein